MSKSIALYFQIHQPFRIKHYTIFDTSHDHSYFSDDTDTDRNNRLLFERVADVSYRPMLELIDKQLKRNPDFKLTLGVTGLVLEQMESWAPDVLESLRQVVSTGRVEVVAETYYHSHAFFYSRSEFEAQVRLHREKVEHLLNYTPRVFRGSNLSYNNDLAAWVKEAGYKGVLAEGTDAILGWRSPNHVYSAEGTDSFPVLLRNYQLSDDLALRFGDHGWSEWPLTSHKFAQWANESSEGAETINLFMNIETFGEHQSRDSGIFQFFDNFCQAWVKIDGNTFKTVSETIDSYPVRDKVDVPHASSWTDSSRDLSAWTANHMQQEATKYAYDLEAEVLATGDVEIVSDWRKLLATDHTYYMATGGHENSGIRNYYNPYSSPFDAFQSYLNVIRDLRWRIARAKQGQ